VIETSAAVWPDRHVPIDAVIAQCRAYQDSRVIDGVLIPDQLANFIPQQLWTAENSPLAAFMSDPDSLCDAFSVAPFIAASVPGLKLHLTTDSVRRPPAELVQAMLTLAYLTEGKATFEVGGGEVKQTGPYGHPTNQGMSRMKDLFQIFGKAVDGDGPFDHDGRRWKLNGAYLGGARPHRPTLWGLGGGPTLLDHVTSYADGLAVAVPNAWPSPEFAADQIAAIRKQVAQKGRDPEKFRIGIWACTIMHDDQTLLAEALTNPILRFVCGALGRTETDRWQHEGLPSPVPPGWAYYTDLLPYAMDDDFVADVVAAVTPEHLRKGFLCGSAAEVAAQVEPYVQAGVDWVCAFDYLPVVGDPADAANAMSRTIELCTLIKAFETKNTCLE
jgi:phthiodiolone/phenolphthiodiolone dimycocerosates ketoreductase